LVGGGERKTKPVSAITTEEGTSKGGRGRENYPRKGGGQSISQRKLLNNNEKI